MEYKKNPVISLHKEKPLFTLLGFIFASTLIFISFSFTVFEMDRPLREFPNPDDTTLQAIDIFPIDQEDEMKDKNDKKNPLNSDFFDINDDDSFSEKDPFSQGETDSTGENHFFSKPDSVFIETEIQEDSIFLTPSTPAYFPGGEEAMDRFLNENLRYPELLLNEGLEGVVLVSFIIEKDGSISKLKILPPYTYLELETEALRVCRLLPRFTPATYMSRPVRTVCLLPVVFNLE